MRFAGMAWSFILKIEIGLTIFHYYSMNCSNMRNLKQLSFLLCAMSFAVFNRAQTIAGPTNDNAALPTLKYSSNWGRQSSASAMNDFESWTTKYLSSKSVIKTQSQEPPGSADASNKEGKFLIEEGAVLAKKRSASLVELIKTNPESALRLTIPYTIRSKLPSEIVSESETRVSGIGDIVVRVADKYPGGPDVDPLQRYAHIGVRTYRAYVYGRRLNETTKYGIPLSGIAVGHVLAIQAEPVREIEQAEKPSSGISIYDLRTSSEREMQSKPAPMAEIGGKIYQFSSREQMLKMERLLEEAEKGFDPRPRASVDEIFKKIKGAPKTNDVSLMSLMPAQSVSTGYHSHTEGLQRIITIRVDFPDATGEPTGVDDSPNNQNIATYTSAYVKNIADTRIAPYYWKSSFGITSLSNTVTTKLYRMPNASDYYATNNSDAGDPVDGASDQLHRDAESLAASDYNLSDYDRIIVLFPLIRTPNTKIGYGGLADLGGTNVWLNGEFDFRCVAHELGHTYGLLHAHLWSIQDGNPISSTGTNDEYGDIYDTMGANFANDNHTDFNPFFKKLLNWIQDSNVLQVTSSGIYRIQPFDSTSASGIMALRLKYDDGCDYWIGYRSQFINNACMQTGAYVIWGCNSPANCSYLLNMNPAGGGVQCAALKSGESFSDAASHISVRNLGQGGVWSNEYLNISVSIGLRASNHN